MKSVTSTSTKTCLSLSCLLRSAINSELSNIMTTNQRIDSMLESIESWSRDQVKEWLQSKGMNEQKHTRNIQIHIPLDVCGNILLKLD